MRRAALALAPSAALAAAGTGSVALAITAAVALLTVFALVLAATYSIIAITGRTGCRPEEAANSVATVVRSALSRGTPGAGSRD